MPAGLRGGALPPRCAETERLMAGGYITWFWDRLTNRAGSLPASTALSSPEPPFLAAAVTRSIASEHKVRGAPRIAAIIRRSIEGVTDAAPGYPPRPTKAAFPSAPRYPDYMAHVNQLPGR